MSSDQGSSDDEDFQITTDTFNKQSAAKKKTKVKPGGFNCLGLSEPILASISKKGYRLPTPIQRKSIPVILSGRDVVAMARTGSGKSAAFIIPMLEKLRQHVMGKPRALILSPTRELAMQTLKFCKELGKLTDLRCALIVGGDSIDAQFDQMATSPDIIIATPGRLLHLMVEMDSDLKGIEFVCFDEADRLFEMGFRDTLLELIHKMEPSRQTVLFSATLPKSLIEFTTVGLKDAVLVRLDTDTKISPDLQLCFFPLRQNEKEATLLYLIKNVIPESHQTIIFASTKYHVEYLHELLDRLNFPNSFIYSSLDPVARVNNLAKFRNGATKFLIVTDIAARGIDIPLLNNVIHFDFPDKAKLFIHRSGRAARAGKSGTAYSLVTHDDFPYFFDLQLFLGRKLVTSGDISIGKESNETGNLVVGGIPLKVLSEVSDILDNEMQTNYNLQSLKKVCENGFKQYCRTRSVASRESKSRTKDFFSNYPLGSVALGVHPIIKETLTSIDNILKEVEIFDNLRNFRPKETIFEVKKMGMKLTPASELMEKRRTELDGVIKKKNTQVTDSNGKSSVLENNDGVIIRSQLLDFCKDKKTRKGRAVGEAIPYIPTDYFAEKQYSLSAGLNSKMELTIGADEKTNSKANQIWDKKKKRFISTQIGSDNKKRIKTDSGRYIEASYKTDAFDKWKKNNGAGISESTNDTKLSEIKLRKKFVHQKVMEGKPLDRTRKDYNRKVRHLKKKAQETGENLENLTKHKSKGNVKSELKSADRIRKDRKIKQKRQEKNSRPSKKRKIY